MTVYGVYGVTVSQYILDSQLEDQRPPGCKHSTTSYTPDQQTETLVLRLKIEPRLEIKSSTRSPTLAIRNNGFT